MFNHICIIHIGTPYRTQFSKYVESCSAIYFGILSHKLSNINNIM